eukprot:2107516-Prymnesium_polylepis.1
MQRSRPETRQLSEQSRCGKVQAAAPPARRLAVVRKGGKGARWLLRGAGGHRAARPPWFGRSPQTEEAVAAQASRAWHRALHMLSMAVRSIPACRSSRHAWRGVPRARRRSVRRSR